MKKQPKLFSILQRRLLNRKFLVFSVCLFFSTFFWLITALYRDHLATFTVPVTFTNLPRDKVLVGELPKELQVTFKATGLKLLIFSLRKTSRELTIDFSSLKKLRENVYSFAPAGQMLHSNLQVTEIKPDYLYFAFNNSYYKTVPVKADVMVDFEPLFNLSSSIKTTPDFVVLSGDSNQVKKIDTIYTEKIILNSLDKSVKQKVRLIYPEEFGNNFFASVGEVQVEINVDKFTDSEVEIPLEVINLPTGMKIKTFPEKVKVKFQVGMNDFEKIHSTMFRAVIDFRNADPGKNYMKIELVKRPGNIRNVKLFPEKAEFLIKK